MDILGTSPDPEATRRAIQVRSALTAAAAGGPLEPACALVLHMRKAGLITTSPRHFLAIQILYLSAQHLRDEPSVPNPFLALQDRIVRLGICEPDEFEFAHNALLLASGVKYGWLSEDDYDAVATYGGHEPDFLRNLAHIRRGGPTTI